MDGPLYRGLYAFLILFQSLVKQNFFDKEDSNCHYNSIYNSVYLNNSTIILLAVSVFTFSSDKNIRTTSS